MGGWPPRRTPDGSCRRRRMWTIRLTALQVSGHALVAATLSAGRLEGRQLWLWCTRSTAAQPSPCALTPAWSLPRRMAGPGHQRNLEQLQQFATGFEHSRHRQQQPRQGGGCCWLFGPGAATMIQVRLLLLPASTLYAQPLTGKGGFQGLGHRCNLHRVFAPYIHHTGLRVYQLASHSFTTDVSENVLNGTFPIASVSDDCAQAVHRISLDHSAKVLSSGRSRAVGCYVHERMLCMGAYMHVYDQAATSQQSPV